MSFKSGFITITGRPNVGKSTLLNSLMGEKIAIVADKPQTTRNAIKAVLTRGDCQLIFIDTPGVHRPKDALGKHMLSSAWDSLDAVDAILFVVEAGEKGPGAGDRFIADRLKKADAPVYLIINKIDRIADKKVLLEQTDAYSKIMDFKSMIPISAVNNDGTKVVLEELIKIIPEGPKYFPDDMITDQPEKIIAAEIIREKAISVLDDEIPYGIGVEVTHFSERNAPGIAGSVADGTGGPGSINEGAGNITNKNAGIIDIKATIYCDKDSHKGIIIGKQGAVLKEIGTRARYDIEKFLAARVFLELWVKVKKGWRNNIGMLNELGYRK